jgi:hypothetical protein
MTARVLDLEAILNEALQRESSEETEVEEKAREDAVRCLEEVPAGRFEIIENDAGVTW